MVLDYWAMIEDNLVQIREKIQRAASKAGRKADEIRIVAVSKGVGVEQIRSLLELGINEIGENRVKEAEEKFGELKDRKLTWHMVGHLQTNKAKKAVEIFDYIHSLDSLRLARQLERCCAGRGKVLPVFVEVNVSGEKSKFGIRPQELEALAEEVIKLPHLELLGLMTLAPLLEHSEEARPYFRRLRELKQALEGRLGKRLYLSMGMSNDFEVAIEEGADFVRIGRAIFGGKL